MSSRDTKGLSSFIQSLDMIKFRLGTSGWLKFFWPTIAILIFTICTMFAFNQSPRPDPWQPVETWSADWFLNPIETNAFKRLPIISGNINDVFVLPEGSNMWVVGDGGLILHSSDGGERWEQQNPLISQQKPTSEKAENGFIPNAYAMQELGRVRNKAMQAQQALPSDIVNPNLSIKEQKPLNRKLEDRKKYLARKKLKNKLAEPKAIKYPDAQATQLIKRTLPSPLSDPYTSDLSSIYFIDAQQGWVTGSNGAILVTDKGGKRWAKQDSGTKVGLTSIQMHSDGQRGWVVGRKGIILTTYNGGKTWIKQSSGTEVGLTSIQMNSDSKRGWVVGEKGIILTTNNSGKTWVKQSSGTEVGLTSIQMHSNGQRGWVVGGKGIILTTNNSGETWVKQNSRTEVGLNSIQMIGRYQGWVAGHGGTILITDDGGRTWIEQNNGTDADMNSLDIGRYDLHGTVPPVEYRYDSQGREMKVQATSLRGWVVGSGGTILVTHNGGETWYPQSISADSPMMMDADGIHGWKIARNNTVNITEDEGKTWQIEQDPYSMYPAPWYYLSFTLCVSFFGFAFGLLAGEAEADSKNRRHKKSIVNKSVTDRPAGPGSPDYLGALKVARGLARFISNRHTSPPVTLAITGDWGSGKSSVMNYLCAQLRRDGLKTVWFNAWHHREEGNVLASMLENVRRQAIPRTPYGLYLRLRLLLKRHWIFKLASVALLFGVSYISVNIFSHAEKQDAAWHYALYTIGVEQPVALSKKSIETFCKHEADATECRTKLLKIKWNPLKKNAQASNGENRFSTNTKLLEKMKQLLQREFSQEDEKAALKAAIHPSPELPFAISSTLVSFIGTLFGLIALLIVKGASIVGVGTTGILQKVLRMAGFERSKEQVGTRQLFERQFRQITELFGKRRLVIFIDDLDRCEKDYTMKVLETTNFLASSGELFMVIGMAPRYVLANVNLHFASLAEAVHEVEQDNNHASSNEDEASPSRASFARRYLQKLINIEVPVPKGDKESTRDMLLGNAGEDDAEGKLEMQRLRLFSRTRKYVWFGIMVGTVALAWQLASYQNAVHQASPQQQHQASSEQAPRETSQQASSANNQAEQSGEINSTNSVARFTPADIEQRSFILIAFLSIIVAVLLLLFLLAWRYRNKWENLNIILKPLGVAIAGPQQTEDSEDFSAALEIWNDVIFHANPNPRKIKVFLNHLRYVSSQMIGESEGHEAHLVSIAVMHYVFGKDIESLDRQNLMEAETYHELCNPVVAGRIGTSWSDHREKFHMLPGENDWDSYLKFIRNVEIHQPHHQRVDPNA